MLTFQIGRSFSTLEGSAMATVSAPAPTLTLTLRDGRRLAYADYGDPQGRPVVFLHGWGDSRLTRHPDDQLTAAAGVRLLTVDRPGVGASDYQPRRTLLRWPDDLRQLADQLGLDRFALLGHSGGGPFALASAWALPERLTAVGVACGFAPVDRPGGTAGLRPEMRRAVPLLRRFPWLARPLLASLPKQYRQDPEQAFEKQFGHGLPASDRAVLAQPAVHANLLAGAVEALRPGAKGLAQELPLFLGRPWSFRPEEIRVPVSLWYGEADTLVPVHMGRYLARIIPTSQLTVYPDEGHTLHLTHWADILRTLTAAG
jgi:pimeloyl-ACP methyl ester carboxylesterase